MNHELIHDFIEVGHCSCPYLGCLVSKVPMHVNMCSVQATAALSTPAATTLTSKQDLRQRRRPLFEYTVCTQR